MRAFNQSLRFTAAVACCFYLYLPWVQAETFAGKVVGIVDGDTLTLVTTSKQQYKIRLAEIDAPEKHQPFGTRSKQSLSDLCFGKQAEVTPRVIDRYKRTVAHIKCAGVDANTEQVNRGMAWVYRRYARNHNLYIQEHNARVAKRGLWSDPHPIAPWEWRNHRKQNVRTL
jgi:endonuclease YncB( thermonuclease family)